MNNNNYNECYYQNLLEKTDASLPYPLTGTGAAFNVPVADNPASDAAYNFILYLSTPADKEDYEIYWNKWAAGKTGGLSDPFDSTIFTGLGKTWYWGGYEQQQPSAGFTEGDFVIVKKTSKGGTREGVRVQISGVGNITTTENIFPVTSETLRLYHLGYI